MHNITHKDNSSRGTFYIEEDNTKLAEMTYSKISPHFVIIDHTLVDPELRGSGAGKALVEASVKWARENEIKIMPLCPFAKAVFEKTKEWADVLKS